MSSFDFLANSSLTKEYYDTVVLAENNMYDKPSVTITQLGILLESLLKYICLEENYSIKDNESMFNIIDLLSDKHVFNVSIASSCHQIRIYNNKCKHSNNSSTEMAQFCLKEIYSVCRWFYKTYMGCVVSIPLEYIIPSKDEIKEAKLELLKSDFLLYYSEELERAEQIKLNDEKIIKKQIKENEFLKKEVEELKRSSHEKDSHISNIEVENRKLRLILSENKSINDKEEAQLRKTNEIVDESTYLHSFNLNDNQLAAVKALDGYVKTIAGPGTGKTHTLTCRYVHLINQKQLSTNEVLCITFTNKAAKEMRDRIKKLLGDQDYSMICTFHGFCYKIFSQYCDLIGFSNNFVVIDDDDTEGIIEEILDASEFEDVRQSKDFSVKKIKQYIRHKKNKERSIYTACIFDECDEFLKKQINRSLDPIDAIYYYFLQRQRIECALQFDDLHNALSYLMLKEPNLIKKLQNDIKYIMVDEFQDINDIQYRLVKLLSGINQNLFVVGDANQTIYSWRGANIKYFDNFQKDFPNVKTFPLVKNYRSTAEIIASAESSISNNLGEIYRLETTTVGTRPVFKLCQNRRDEVDWVCTQVSNLVSLGTKLNDMAIIYRKNEIAGHFQKKLHELKIPFVIYGGKGLFKTDEVKTIICYLQMILKDNDFAFKRTVSMPPRGIGTKRLEKLNWVQSQKRCSLFEALKINCNETEFKNTGAIEYISVIEELRNDMDNIPISSLILKLVDKINLKDYFSNGEEIGLENVFEFIRVVEDIEESNIVGKQPALRLADFLDSIATLDESSKKSEDTLKLMSAHAAKGLEFNHVFVCGLEEGTFPLSCRNEEMFFEERRLFFVALTRAKEKLYLSGSQNLKDDSDDFSMNVSRFVSEIRSTITVI